MKLHPATALLAVIAVIACRTAPEPAPERETAPPVPAIMDANGNGVDDSLDIMNGTSLDEDSNGIPDEAEDRG